MNKKRLSQLMVYFFSLLLLFTFISKSVYNAKLPVVTVISANQSAIVQSMSVNGELFYSNSEKVIAQSAFTVQKVFIKKGMDVSEGQPLFSVDISQQELDKLSLELEILRIDNSLSSLTLEAAAATLASARKNIKMREQELSLQRDIALMRMEQLVASYPPDGVVTANKRGVVDRVYIEPGDRISAGMVCVETHPQDADLFVSFTLSLREMKQFQSPDVIKATFHSLFWDEETESTILITETLIARSSEKTYSDKTDRYEVIIRLMAPKGSPMLAEKAEIFLTTGSLDAYSYVVPASCVHRDQDGYYVFILEERTSLFGIETYVRRADVTVLTSNASYAAISSNEIIDFWKIVVTSTLSLYPNNTVLVQSS